jgi:hypothetical protein
MFGRWMARIGSAATTRAASLGPARVFERVREAQARAASHGDVALAFATTDDAADALTGAVPEPAAASSPASSGLIADS